MEAIDYQCWLIIKVFHCKEVQELSLATDPIYEEVEAAVHVVPHLGKEQGESLEYLVLLFGMLPQPLVLDLVLDLILVPLIAHQLTAFVQHLLIIVHHCRTLVVCLIVFLSLVSSLALPLVCEVHLLLWLLSQQGLLAPFFILVSHLKATCLSFEVVL